MFRTSGCYEGSYQDEKESRSLQSWLFHEDLLQQQLPEKVSERWLRAAESFAAETQTSVDLQRNVRILTLRTNNKQQRLYCKKAVERQLC